MYVEKGIYMDSSHCRTSRSGPSITNWKSKSRLIGNKNSHIGITVGRRIDAIVRLGKCITTWNNYLLLQQIIIGKILDLKVEMDLRYLTRMEPPTSEQHLSWINRLRWVNWVGLEPSGTQLEFEDGKILWIIWIINWYRIFYWTNFNCFSNIYIYLISTVIFY